MDSWDTCNMVVRDSVVHIHLEARVQHCDLHTTRLLDHLKHMMLPSSRQEDKHSTSAWENGLGLQYLRWFPRTGRLE